MTPMPLEAQIILVLHLAAALAFLLSVVIHLGRRLARKAFEFFSLCLDGAARGVR